MKKILPLIFLFINTLSYSQDFRYLSVREGLSNRRVYSIEKDNDGYMWFLTQEGIDRFNGISFKHYGLALKDDDLPSIIYLKYLLKDSSGTIWEISEQGHIFKYDILFDKFRFIDKLSNYIPELNSKVHHTYVDNNDQIWLCTAGEIYLYDINKQKFKHLHTSEPVSIKNITCVQENHYFINTSQGVYFATLNNETLELNTTSTLRIFYTEISSLCYHPASNQLLMGSSKQGIFIYDIENDLIYNTNSPLDEITINCIKIFNEEEVLLATEAAGIYKMNVNTYGIEPFLTSDTDQQYRLNGNNIKDFYIDEEKRIWIANYPIGITIFDSRYPQYKWMRHLQGNKNSLVNDQVNYILEDSEGDLWFATNNGISLYEVKNDTWTTLLSNNQNEYTIKNNIFLTLCEISPGNILAGGYMSGLYSINKRNFHIDHIPYKDEVISDKYTHTIYKDRYGKIWIGGNKNLRYVHDKTYAIEKLYTDFNSINVILEKDSMNIWIGCNDGLYLLNKKNDEIRRIDLRNQTGAINTLYQTNDEILYIGTNNIGMIVYNPKTDNTTLFHKHNSNLISNTIHCILPQDDNLIISTEHCLSQFSLKTRTFKNWTQERGLVTNHFNPNAGTATQRNTFLFGSGKGVVEFDKSIHVPTEYKHKIIFNDFQLFYRTVSPGEKYSPLKRNINETREIVLDYNQNIFSINLSSINYDNPSNILYSWKLEGFYNEWNKPTSETSIRFTNLNPGKYTLRIRAISNEDLHVIEERSLNIIVNPPFWKTIWAQILYILLISLIIWSIMRHSYIRKQAKDYSDKVASFINTAHDIRTPLSLIKGPLDDLADCEEIDDYAQEKIELARKNTNDLLRLINNLINFGTSNIYADKLCTEEVELYNFLEDIVKQFKGSTDSKNIKLIYKTNFSRRKVWTDKAKLDSIIKNLLSNAIKYTPEKGRVTVTALDTLDHWSIEIEDTGIGIPAEDQNKLFKAFFRGKNVIHTRFPGNGIGLLIANKMVHLLKGKIKVKTEEDKGSTFKVIFRHSHSNLAGKIEIEKEEHAGIKQMHTIPDIIKKPYIHTTPKEFPELPDAPTILVAEDETDLREYLRISLSDEYNVVTASNGIEALQIIKDNPPNLVISDIKMPEMRGDLLCLQLKNDIHTSHIPVILLSGLNGNKDIIEGLATYADKYLSKPFNTKILKAHIKNILANREILAQSYSKMKLPELKGKINSTNKLDMEFMKKLIEYIDENMSDPEFNIDTACAALNMSRSKFYTKIKALTKKSPSEFIRKHRMDRATALLESGEFTITQVADMVGFSDPKYFRDVFKKYFNMPPTQYAKENKE